MITAEVVFSAFFWAFIIMAVLVLGAVMLDMRPPYEERQARKCDRAERRYRKLAGSTAVEVFLQIITWGGMNMPEARDNWYEAANEQQRRAQQWRQQQ